MLSIDDIKKKYPLNMIEKHFKDIEKLGYQISTSEYQCTIWDNDRLIIDADFYDDFHSNAADAIYAFYYK